MEKTFIKTTDIETANQLIALGFQLISHIGNVHTFLNETPRNMTFESIDQTKIAYDNKLNL